MKGPWQRAGLGPTLARLAPFFIVAGAAALRLWAIDSGLPFTAARPDEREALQYTAGFPNGDLNPRWFIYPNFYFYVVWIWEELLLAARRLALPTQPYQTMLREELPRLILNGRMLSAAVGTTTVALVYAAGRAVGGRTLGLIAALLLACNFLHIRDSHALKPDVFLGLGVLVSLWALARSMEKPGRSRSLVAGLSIGLTTALKYPGILLMVPAYLAEALTSPRAGLQRLLPTARIVLLGMVAALTFLATSPYLILDLERTVETGSFAGMAVYATRPQDAPSEGAGQIESALNLFRTRTFGYHLTVSLRHGGGLLLALVTPFALLLALRRPRQPMLLLSAAFSLCYYLVVGASPVHLARYLTPLMPLVALLGANLVCVVTGYIRRPALRAAVICGLSLALVAEPLASTLAHSRIAARTDTRVQATRWMEEHLPAGSVVTLLGSTFFPIADPELPRKVRRAQVRLGETDLDSHGVTHVVTHEHLLPFSQLNARQMSALDPHLRLLAEFSPFSGAPAGAYESEDAYYIPFFEFRGVKRPGPLVRIYAYEVVP